MDVSVVMPVYNGERYLSEAIESILNQTLTNFEFLIICEYGTNQESLKLVKKYAKMDKRISPLYNNVKLGISASLNVGLRMARGKYIARMDADDISAPQRFEVQKLFMDCYQHIGICGTKHTVIGSPNWLVDFHADPAQIKSDLLFFVPLRHPTIMIRREVVENELLYYNEDLPGTEDYEFFIHAAKVTQLSNLMDNDLFQYRRAEGNASSIHMERDNKIKLQLMSDILLQNLCMDMSDSEIDSLVTTTCFSNKDKNDFTSIIKLLDNCMLKIVEQNKVIKAYDYESLNQTMFHRWSRAKYNLDLIYNNKIPDAIIFAWKQGAFYQPWMLGN